MSGPVPRSAHPGVQHFHWARIADRLASLRAVAGASWFPDISEFNGPVDWAALGAAYQAGTIAAVAIRSSFGTVRADAQLGANQQGARARGIPAVYYHFAYPAYNQASAEAAFMNYVVGPLMPNEAMCGDFEDDPSANPFPRGAAGLDWCRAFLTALEAPPPATWGYSYPYLVSSVGLQPIVDGWPFWMADYGATPDSAFAPAIARQFTDCGTTPGVGGCCDQSRVLRGPLSQWLTPGAVTPPRSTGGQDMAAAPRPDGSGTDLFTVHLDGTLQHYFWAAGQPDVQALENLGGTLVPHTASCWWQDAGQALVVAAQTTSGAYGKLIYTSAGGWGSWAPLSMTGALPAAPAATPDDDSQYVTHDQLRKALSDAAAEA